MRWLLIVLALSSTAAAQVSDVEVPMIVVEKDTEKTGPGDDEALDLANIVQSAAKDIRVTAQHTKKDFADCMQWLVDEVYPLAERIRIVLDNLSTHRPAALYENFRPEEARRLLSKLEFHYTPKHGSWFNMAEIELSVFGRTMKNYIPEEERFRVEAQALTNERNLSKAKVDWHFRSTDARIKLKQLYPSISS